MAAARALCQRLLEFEAALVAALTGGGVDPGMLEDLFGLHVEEAQAHGAMAHDAFDVAAASAAAEAFFFVERDDGVAALPDALCEGVAAVADADAESPDADHGVELAVD